MTLSNRPAMMATIALTVFTSLSALAAKDLPFEAKVYDQDSNKQQLLFTYKHDNEVKGETRINTNIYRDAPKDAKEGAIVAIETVEFAKAGGREGERDAVQSYRMQQKQLNTEGLVEVKGDKVKFSYTKDGKTKTSEEELTDNFLVGPSITSYLQAHWDEIKKGARVKGRLAVPDRAETVGFEYFKDGEEDLAGQKAIVVKMKPSSFLISALVKPLYFVYTLDGSRLLEVRGRTQLKRNVGGSWKDLDAVTVFNYGSEAASAPVPAPAPSPAPSPTGNSK